MIVWIWVPKKELCFAHQQIDVYSSVSIGKTSPCRPKVYLGQNFHLHQKGTFGLWSCLGIHWFRF